jgi:hypothetical protein
MCVQMLHIHIYTCSTESKKLSCLIKKREKHLYFLQDQTCAHSTCRTVTAITSNISSVVQPLDKSFAG